MFRGSKLTLLSGVILEAVPVVPTAIDDMDQVRVLALDPATLLLLLAPAANWPVDDPAAPVGFGQSGDLNHLSLKSVLR